MALEWIDEALTEGVLPVEYPDPAEVAPATDIEEVNRLLRKLRAVRRRREQATTIAQSEIVRITAWLGEQVAPFDAAEEYILRALEGWVRSDFEHSAVKTHKLPNGELKLRPKHSAVEVTDEDAAVRWLTTHGLKDDCVKVVTSVLKTQVSDLAARGDVVRVDKEAGLQYRRAVIDVADPNTGEITAWEVPGVLLRERVDGQAGHDFSVTVIEQGPV